MARIREPDSGMWRRVPALKGRLQILTNGRGTLYVRAWPRKRSRPLHPTTQAQNALFTAIQTLAKRVDPEIMIAAISMTKGTALMPRDIITKALYGKLVVLHQINGRSYVPQVTRQQISAMLDLLDNTPGFVLFRDAEFWSGQEASALGGSDSYAMEPFTTLTAVDGTARATKGIAFTPGENMTVSRARMYWSPGAGLTWRFSMVQVDAGNVITDILAQTDYSAAVQEKRIHEVPLACSLGKGGRYCLLVSRTGAGNTPGWNLFTKATENWNGPFVNLGHVSKNAEVLTVGLALGAFDSTKTPRAGLRYQIVDL